MKIILPPLPDNLAFDLDTNQLRIVVPIVSGVIIGAENTCQSLHALTSFDDKWPNLIEYRNLISALTLLLEASSTHNQANQRILSTINLLSETFLKEISTNTINIIKPDTTDGFLSYPKPILNLFKNKSNLFSMRLSPPIKDSILHFDDPLFSLERVPLFYKHKNTTFFYIFSDHQLESFGLWYFDEDDISILKGIDKSKWGPIKENNTTLYNKIQSINFEAGSHKQLKLTYEEIIFIQLLLEGNQNIAQLNKLLFLDPEQFKYRLNFKDLYKYYLYKNKDKINTQEYATASIDNHKITSLIHQINLWVADEDENITATPLNLEEQSINKIITTLLIYENISDHDVIETIINSLGDEGLTETSDSNSFFNVIKITKHNTMLKADKPSIDMLGIVAQFFFGSVNIDCYAKDLSTINFGKVIENKTFAKKILTAIRAAILNNKSGEKDSIALSLIEIINKNYQQFGLRKPISEDEAASFICNFKKRFSQINGSPHYDEFIILTTEKAGRFFNHAGSICCFLSDCMTSQANINLNTYKTPKLDHKWPEDLQTLDIQLTDSSRFYQTLFTTLINKNPTKEVCDELLKLIPKENLDEFISYVANKYMEKPNIQTVLTATTSNINYRALVYVLGKKLSSTHFIFNFFSFINELNLKKIQFSPNKIMELLSTPNHADKITIIKNICDKLGKFLTLTSELSRHYRYCEFNDISLLSLPNAVEILTVLTNNLGVLNQFNDYLKLMAHGPDIIELFVALANNMEALINLGIKGSHVKEIMSTKSGDLKLGEIIKTATKLHKLKITLDLIVNITKSHDNEIFSVIGNCYDSLIKLNLSFDEIKILCLQGGVAVLEKIDSSVNSLIGNTPINTILAIKRSVTNILDLGEELASFINHGHGIKESYFSNAISTFSVPSIIASHSSPTTCIRNSQKRKSDTELNHDNSAANIRSFNNKNFSKNSFTTPMANTFDVDADDAANSAYTTISSTSNFPFAYNDRNNTKHPSGRTTLPDLDLDTGLDLTYCLPSTSSFTHSSSNVTPISSSTMSVDQNTSFNQSSLTFFNRPNSSSCLSQSNIISTSSQSTVTQPHFGASGNNNSSHSSTSSLPAMNTSSTNSTSQSSLTFFNAANPFSSSLRSNTTPEPSTNTNPKPSTLSFLSFSMSTDSE
ncbi:MAG: hypothetical protein KIT27_09965 [Legionellales bacterium]|nr:hypothetical protein [Legionellales bacterium]